MMFRQLGKMVLARMASTISVGRFIVSLSEATASGWSSARNDPRFTASFSVVRKPPAPSFPRIARRRDSSGAYLGEELLRPCDAAEHKWCDGRCGYVNFSSHQPDEFSWRS